MSDTKKQVAAEADEEVQEEKGAKSAEDRKAAAALAALDATGGDDDNAGSAVDRDAVNKAMGRLAGAEEKKEVKKVKVDAADATLLVEELELPKTKATELLKQHDGDAVKAMRAHIAIASA